MVIKIYISGMSGNKEVKKRQQRVLLILDSKNVKYEVIDIAEPGAEEAKDFMHNKSTSVGATIGDPNPRHALPPQIFNDDSYCGDYDLFDMANEIDEMEKFLKLEPNSLNEQIANAEVKLKNGDASIDEKIENLANAKIDIEEPNKENEVPNEQEAENEDVTKEKSEERDIEPEKEDVIKEKSEEREVEDVIKEKSVDREVEDVKKEKSVEREVEDVIKEKSEDREVVTKEKSEEREVDTKKEDEDDTVDESKKESEAEEDSGAEDDKDDEDNKELDKDKEASPEKSE